MKDLKPAILLLIVFTVICGGAYPAVVTGIAHALFPSQAQGSLVVDNNGRETGSKLIGQPFSDPKYFWPRPSATADFAYNPAASGGSNMGPANPAYLRIVADRVKALRDGGLTGPIPAELAQASGSGLDPHISPEAARIQIPRVAKARAIELEKIMRLVDSRVEDRTFGVLGSPRINVLELNLELDKL